MHSHSIQKLIEAVLKNYEGLEYYGSSRNEEHGVCFMLQDKKVTFSVSTLGGSLVDTYDIQVEGIPVGEYVYTEEVTIPNLIQLIDTFSKAESLWP